MEIRLENMCFGYDKSHEVLHDINLVLDKPGLVCIVGPNGVGKSTLVRCINGISKPTSGTVYINGRDISTMRLKDIAKVIGYVPAATDDCFSMPVIDTIMVGRHNLQKFGTKTKDLEMVHRAMSVLGLEPLAMRGFNELSAGQHQKVAIARGLVTETEVMILDEPTSNLDIRHQVYVSELLRAIAEEQEKLIIMICHDLNIAAKYAHRVILMAPPGVVGKDGTPAEVFTKESIRTYYGVDCDILDLNGIPHIILGFALPENSESGY